MRHQSNQALSSNHHPMFWLQRYARGTEPWMLGRRHRPCPAKEPHSRWVPPAGVARRSPPAVPIGPARATRRTQRYRLLLSCPAFYLMSRGSFGLRPTMGRGLAVSDDDLNAGMQQIVKDLASDPSFRSRGPVRNDWYRDDNDRPMTKTGGAGDYRGDQSHPSLPRCRSE